MNIIFNKTQNNRYERMAIIYDLDKVYSLIKNNVEFLEINNEKIPLSGLRLKTFAKSEDQCCSDPNCEVKTSHFAIERSIDGHSVYSNWHLNLYGIKNNKEVLFTHDHTLARALGGADDETNTTLMCSRCNFKKSIIENKAVLIKREEEEKLNDPEGYAKRKEKERLNKQKRERKKIENILKAGEHFLELNREEIVKKSNEMGGDKFQNNKTSYSDFGLTPKGYKWLNYTVTKFFVEAKNKKKKEENNEFNEEIKNKKIKM